jgi:hypothetical protein
MMPSLIALIALVVEDTDEAKKVPKIAASAEKGRDHHHGKVYLRRGLVLLHFNTPAGCHIHQRCGNGS